MTSPRISKLIAASVWGLLLLSGAEMASRIFLFPEYTAMLPDMYVRHPVLDHYNKPNLEVRRFNPMNYDVLNHTNSLGMRGLETNLEEELAGYWIAGGSNTFGGYVEDDETYVRIVNKNGHPAANLSSEGHSIIQQSLLIRHLGNLGYRPQAVILAPPIFHSIRDYTKDRNALTRPIENVALVTQENANRPRDRWLAAVAQLWEGVPASLQSIRARLLTSSALYGYLKVGIMGIPALRKWTLETGLRADVDLVYNFDLDLLRPFDGDNPATADIESTADFIAAIADMVYKRFDVPFAVVLLATPHQIDPKSFSRFVNHLGLQGQDLDPARLIITLKAALEKRHVPVLDTLPMLRAANGDRLTFPDDGHLNAKGHAIVGKAVTGWLKAGMVQ